MSSSDPRVRLRVLVEAVSAATAVTLPLGRRLIALTVERPEGRATERPVRGYRRIAWIEAAVEPMREPLGPDRFERLVSSLAMVIGFEAFVVLFDVRGLDDDAARSIVLDAALAPGRGDGGPGVTRRQRQPSSGARWVITLSMTWAL